MYVCCDMTCDGEDDGDPIVREGSPVPFFCLCGGFYLRTTCYYSCTNGANGTNGTVYRVGLRVQDSASRLYFDYIYIYINRHFFVFVF